MRGESPGHCIFSSPTHPHTVNVIFGHVLVLLLICSKCYTCYGLFDESLREECEVSLVRGMSGGSGSGQNHFVKSPSVKTCRFSAAISASS